MDAAKLRTRGDLVFVATVQEEIGLKGMYHWMEQNKGVADMVVALDSGLGPVNYGALGIYWSRMKFTAPGAHTNNSRGQPNPGARGGTVHHGHLHGAAPAGGRAGQRRLQRRRPDVRGQRRQRHSAGGDLQRGPANRGRGAAPVAGCRDRRPNARQPRRRTKSAFTREWIQRSEAGGRPEQLTDRRAHPLVQTAIDVLRYLGVELPKGREAVASGSTDANVGVVQGIPSIAVGRARGGDQHTLQEWSDIESAKIGTKQIILLASALAELQ